MENIDITRVSSKGQVVIPVSMRTNFKEGDKLVIIQNSKQLILEKVDDFDKNIEEDLEFARRTEEAWQEIKEGKGITVSSEDFLKEMKSW